MTIAIPDAVAERIVHGTPRGYELGCKSQGGCDNHDDPKLMTCADAARAARADWSLKSHPQDEPWPKKIRRLTRPKLRIVDASVRATAPQSQAPTTRTPPPSHDGEKTRSSTPRKTRAARRRTSTARRADGSGRGPQPINHGTVWGYARGCKTIEGCPNHAAGQPTCIEERRRYSREYNQRRRRGEGPRIAHGTTTGYSMGCHSREDCPGNSDGLTCSDAQRAAETARRRAQGVAPRAELTDSTPARAHVHALRESGMSIMKIASTSQVSKTAIRCLIYGRDDYVNGEKGSRHGQIPARITVMKSRRILAIELPEKTP